MSERRETQADLNYLLAYWQERLRLRDWNVKVRFAHTTEVGPNRAGEIEYNEDHKVAEIRIVYPEQAKHMSGPVAVSPEEIIVHELLHLHFDAFAVREEDGKSATAEEIACNLVAKALVSERHGINEVGVPEPEQWAKP